METTSIGEIYETLSQLIASGDEETATTYLQEHFADLPEEVQGEIAFLTLADAIEREVQSREAIVDAQAGAMTAIEVLEKYRDGTNAAAVDKP